MKNIQLIVLRYLNKRFKKILFKITKNKKIYALNNVYIKKENEYTQLFFKDDYENILLEAFFEHGSLRFEEEALFQNPKQNFFIKPLTDNENHFYLKEDKLLDIIHKYISIHKIEYFSFNGRSYLINNLDIYFEKYIYINN